MRNAMIGLVLGLLAAAAAHGEDLPALPIRYLTFEAATIVLAEPAEPKKLEGGQQRFAVLEVLKGPRIKAGSTITVRQMELYQVGEPKWMHNGKATAQPGIVRALLFLAPPEAPKAATDVFNLVLSGLRYLDAEKRVLHPVQFMNPGGYSLVPEKGAEWDSLVAGVRADLPRIAEALALKDILDLADRNRAIFAWIEKHRGEFSGNVYRGTKDKPGWAQLEAMPFEWILETCRADDAWRALKLARQIGGDAGSMPSTRTATFASPEGRRLLLGIVTGEHAAADRKMALDRLRGSMWPRWQTGEHPNLANVTPQEQAEMIEKTTPLLKSKDDEVRGLAARVLADVSSPHDGAIQGRDTAAAMPALAEAYRKEPPGSTRNEIAEIVHREGGAGLWERLSGNPAGILVIVYSFNMNENYGREAIHFSARIPRLAGKAISEQPTLVMERLGEKDAVVERKTMPLPVSNPKDLWKKGWSDHDGVISVEVPSASMAEGLWRFVLEGTAGTQPRKKWRSEPGLFQLKRTK